MTRNAETRLNEEFKPKGVGGHSAGIQIKVGMSHIVAGGQGMRLHQSGDHVPDSDSGRGDAEAGTGLHAFGTGGVSGHRVSQLPGAAATAVLASGAVVWTVASVPSAGGSGSYLGLTLGWDGGLCSWLCSLETVLWLFLR